MGTEGHARNGVTLESIQVQVAVMQTQMTTMQTQMTTMQTSLEARMIAMQTSLEARMTAMQTRLEARMTTMENNLQGLQDAFHTEKGRTTTWLTNLDDSIKRLDHKHDILVGRFDKHEAIVVPKLEALEASAVDARRRLERIEFHLQIEPLSVDQVPPSAMTSQLTVKRSKKS